MFISKQQLHDHLGVDPAIAAFFVDRKVPVDNLYWKNRLIYVSSGTGFLFLPLFFDLKLRCGASRKDILDERYVLLMEAILHSAALHEMNGIGFTEHVENCKTLMESRIRNQELYDDLLVYFSDEQLRPYKLLGTPSKALGRADTFLFSLCNLEPPQGVMEKIIDTWYALIPAFLLMDDISDLREDQLKNEENAVNDFGEGKAGVEIAIIFLRDKFSRLKTFNEDLGNFFERSLEKQLRTPYMQSLLNT